MSSQALIKISEGISCYWLGRHGKAAGMTTTRNGDCTSIGEFIFNNPLINFFYQVNTVMKT